MRIKLRDICTGTVSNSTRPLPSNDGDLSLTRSPEPTIRERVAGKLTYQSRDSKAAATTTTKPKASTGISAPVVVLVQKPGVATPNLSLNIHGQISRSELYIVAIFGTMLQLGILVYYGIATCYLNLLNNGEPVASHAFPTTVLGTFSLVIGMLLCAHIIDGGTSETTFRPGPGRKARVVWLQRCGTVNDQTFEPFAIFPPNDSAIITTSNRASEALDLNHGKLGVSTTRVTTVIGASLSLCGFLAQYTGLHGLHWSASVTQLGATLAMAALRAWVRRNLANSPKALPLVANHELDWLAMTFWKPKNSPWSQPAGSAQESDFIQHWKPSAIEEPENCGELEIAPETSELGVTTKSAGLLRLRRDLGKLADWLGPASLEAVSLSRAIEITMDALFDNLSEEHRWSLTVNNEPVYFRLTRGQTGRWKAYSDELEAALSLWLYSVHDQEHRPEDAKCRNKQTEASRGDSNTEQEGRSSNNTVMEQSFGGSLDDDDTWLRAKGVPSKHSLKLLGLHTAALHRDLQWWVPSGASQVVNISDIGAEANNAVEVEPHRVVGFASSAFPCVNSSSADKYRCYRATTNSPGQDTALAVESFAPLKTLYAQYMFSSFMWSAAKKLEQPFGGEADVQPIREDSTSNSNSAWQSIKLHNKRLSKLALDIQATGLGSLDEIYYAIIPPLSATGRLPHAGAIIEWTRKHAGPHEQLGHWREATDAYMWLFRTAATFSEAEDILPKATALLAEWLNAISTSLQLRKDQHFETRDIQHLGQIRAELHASLHGQSGHVGKILAGIMRLFVIQDRRPTCKWETTETLQSLNDEDEEEALFKFTNLHRAAKDGDYMYIEGKQISAEVNNKDLLDWTPLHYAVGSPSSYATRKLLEYRADVNARDIRGRTPLHYACGSNNNNVSIVQMLLRECADINVQDAEGVTPAHCAARNGCRLTMQLLIESGASVDVVDRLGNTPLLWAVYQGHLTLVEDLWEHSNTRLRDHNGRGPLHLAAIMKAQNAAIKQELLTLLINKGADINTISRDGRTPLHLAVVSGCQPTVKLLLDENAAKEVTDVNGRTPLHTAVVSGNAAITDLLCQEGADKEARDGDERTPLHLAVVSGHKAIARLLVKHGSDTRAMDRVSRNTPLHLAVEMGDEAMVKMLVRDGADIEANGANFGRTPLHLAVVIGAASIVGLLLEEGASTEARDSWSQATPLHEAADSGSEVITKLLLARGADREARDDQGRTPMDLAEENGHELIAGLLGGSIYLPTLLDR